MQLRFDAPSNSLAVSVSGYRSDVELRYDNVEPLWVLDRAVSATSPGPALSLHIMSDLNALSPWSETYEWHRDGSVVQEIKGGQCLNQVKGAGKGGKGGKGLLGQMMYGCARRFRPY